MADILQNSKDNIDWDGLSWVDKKFSHPERTIRLATSFSGIGAIEYALKRLGVRVIGTGTLVHSLGRIQLASS
ncbi:MAG: hypothetical protein PUD67_05515 [Prevotellaceae bacterium]|nr:hypothetical protein [Prevotellaceae bacterium]